MKFHIWSGSHILKPADLTRGLKALTKLGFEHKISSAVARYSVKNQQPMLPFLAGSDKIKVQEFLKICEDPKANWILATRGGYGCLRLLKSLDLSQIPWPNLFTFRVIRISPCCNSIYGNAKAGRTYKVRFWVPTLW